MPDERSKTGKLGTERGPENRNARRRATRHALILVLAARLKDRKNHQVGIGKKPLFSFGAGGLGGARDHAKVLVSGDAVKMIEANAGQSRYFIFGEEFLTATDSHHGVPLSHFDAHVSLSAVSVPCNRASVPYPWNSRKIALGGSPAISIT